eukprot:Nitzschia sp. Nitz4//scaffold58_size112336//44360//46517//NITZ4_004030-RA/size112336-exonerate_est2genome-gene-0.33-mRNA-1//1//CDS//3329554980//8531//frame0
MALRAFHSNPNIGGFGSENTNTLLLGGKRVSKGSNSGFPENDRDHESGAMSQIVKELVDNAVDACEADRKQSSSKKQCKNYRVKVEILPYNDDDKTLQILVSDNGIGMSNIQDCVNAFNSTKGKGVQNTTGRYGIGLTLCLLHAQRLVPGSYSCVTSATQQARTFTRALYVVETASDQVACHREEQVPKTNPEESGTCVSVLVPGGRVAATAWQRLSNYLSRFQLTSLHCSIEVLAPTLSRLPIQIEYSRDSIILGGSKDEVSVVSDLQEGLDCTAEEDSLDGTRSGVLGSFLLQRTRLCEASRKYPFFKKPLTVHNIAHAEFPIRIYPPGSSTVKPTDNAPMIHVDLIVSPHEETPQPSASMEVVRMVNSVPLLDGVDACACGLIKAINSKNVWGAFGLEVAIPSEEYVDPDSWQQCFFVKDSEQVFPFFQDSNHQLWTDRTMEGGCDTKKRVLAILNFPIPAKVRLGRILALVNIVATPTDLPLPTLSKGRLPINHAPITQALHLALRSCLRSLQTTSPGLFLTPSQLQTAERDSQYIPLIARAASRILSRSDSVNNKLGSPVEALEAFIPIPGDFHRLDDSSVTNIIEKRISDAIRDAEELKNSKKRRKKRTDSFVNAGQVGLQEFGHSDNETGASRELTGVVSCIKQGGQTENEYSETERCELPPSSIITIMSRQENHGIVEGCDDDHDWW